MLLLENYINAIIDSDEFLFHMAEFSRRFCKSRMEVAKGSAVASLCWQKSSEITITNTDKRQKIIFVKSLAYLGDSFCKFDFKIWNMSTKIISSSIEMRL